LKINLQQTWKVERGRRNFEGEIEEQQNAAQKNKTWSRNEYLSVCWLYVQLASCWMQPATTELPILPWSSPPALEEAAERRMISSPPGITLLPV